MRLRPKVVQLIRKYEQKQGAYFFHSLLRFCSFFESSADAPPFPADLQGLSDKVAHAKATYEQMAGLPPSRSLSAFSLAPLHR